jgi:flagellar biosynthesis/type III secretory pathway M-ring protein FliF/YscJ
MRMYVILAVLVVLLLVVLAVLGVLAAQAARARREARKREAVAARLEAVVKQAAQEHQDRSAHAKASSALTTVLPAIKLGEQQPRRVA